MKVSAAKQSPSTDKKILPYPDRFSPAHLPHFSAKPMKMSLQYAVKDLVPYISWSYFFFAWNLSARYSGITGIHDCPSCRTEWENGFPENERPAAHEAAKLYRDARLVLQEIADKSVVKTRFGLFPAQSDEDDILLYTDMDHSPFRLPMLRRQTVRHEGEPFLCLADFVSPHRPETDDIHALPIGNVVGLFVTATEGPSPETPDKDDYHRLLVHTLSDRLAEAAAEKLHEEIRRRYWGYCPHEKLDKPSLFSEKFQGIRPAVGYPSLPDQSIIFEMDRLLDFGKIGVTLTENGMMNPPSAVAGMCLGHPLSHHFSVGLIDENGLTDYARRRGKNPESLRPFLRANLFH